MILEQLRNWEGSVELDGEHFDTMLSALQKRSNSNDTITNIVLHSAKEKLNLSNSVELNNKQVCITVKSWMMKQSVPGFDFMYKWNNNNPMPLKTMIGYVLKETNGMVYMKLHGDIVERRTVCCMRCGKNLVNPVSQFFGMGPECGNHNYVNPFNSEDELNNAVDKYRKEYLQKITWEGWIVKSAITSQYEVNE